MLLLVLLVAAARALERDTPGQGDDGALTELAALVLLLSAVSAVTSA